MKILHLIYTNGIAGAEKYLMHLLPPLKEYGIDCHLILVCSSDFEEPLQKYCVEMTGMGIPATLLVSSRTGFVNTAQRIGNYLKKNDINYIHSHLLNTDVLATIVKLFFNPKVVIISTKHGYKESILKQIPNERNIAALKKESRGELYYYVTKFVIKHAKYNYAVSKAISGLYNDLGLTKGEIPYIHHGVTVKETPKSQGLNQFRISDKQLIIVGRLEEFKGHSYLIEAMPAILKEFPECKLIIIGEGSEKEKLLKLANKLEVASQLVFMGFNNDPYSHVNSSDVIVLPSLFEPFGLVYIEAFALKIPVVAFDTPAGNEIMVNDETALLAEARNSKDLSDKIIYLLQNPEAAGKMAARAYKEYQQNFSTQRMVEDTASFYTKIENSERPIS